MAGRQPMAGHQRHGKEEAQRPMLLALSEILLVEGCVSPSGSGYREHRKQAAYVQRKQGERLNLLLVVRGPPGPQPSALALLHRVAR